MSIKRRYSRQVKVGQLMIGGQAPVSIQSMVKADAHDVSACVKQILELEEIGCEIIRMGFLDLESVRNISAIKKQIHIPLVADIHFDYRLALEAIKQGADKLRLNPGNIGTQSAIKEVVMAAKKQQVPIRIGVNAGSLQKDLLKKYGGRPVPAAMVESASAHIHFLESLGFDQIVVSLKASDVRLMIAAYRLFAQKFDYPLHLGVTEAGGILSSSIKSSIGIGNLLLDGIGDTIRVSVTGDNREEIKIGREILKHLRLRKEPILIACPTCSRTQWQMLPVVAQIEQYLEQVKKPLKVAVMGCAVNGPGEASEADVGVAGGNGVGIIFVKGKVVATVPEADLVTELIKRIDAWP